MGNDPFEDQRRTLNDPNHTPTTMLGGLAREGQNQARQQFAESERLRQQEASGPRAARGKGSCGFYLAAICIMGFLWMTPYWWGAFIVAVLTIVARPRN